MNFLRTPYMFNVFMTYVGTALFWHMLETLFTIYNMQK